MIRNQRHADAGCDLEPVPVNQHRLGQQRAEAIGQAINQLGYAAHIAFQARQQNHELITTESRHGVFHAHAGFKARSGHFQHAVANRMAERVVDVLEMIKVEKQQGAAQVMAFEQGNLLAQAIHQQGAVG